MSVLSALRSGWDAKVLPILVEKACRSHAILEERRRWIPEARGHVIEVGVGSGLNLPFYAAGAATDVVGVDISEPLLARARPRAVAAHVPVTLALGDGEHLAFDRARFDSAVVTYTLCSVPSIARVLAEIRRVLVPGGALILVEHGASPDASTLRWQRAITPLWKRAGGNCHLDRDIRGELARAGFDLSGVISGDDSGAPRWMSNLTRGVTRAE